MPFEITTLDEFLDEYGPELAREAEAALAPLHVPGRDKLDHMPKLLREPFEPQAHVIYANIKLLNRQKTSAPIGEMGTGKTIMGIGIVHGHAAQRLTSRSRNRSAEFRAGEIVRRQRTANYRALVMCPTTLLEKWERELVDTLPNVKVTHIRSWKELTDLDPLQKPKGAHWYIIGREKAKLGSEWKPAAVQRKVQGKPDRKGRVRERTWPGLFCPRCGEQLLTKRDELVSLADLAKNRKECGKCGEQLWQEHGDRLDRYSPALFIKRKLHGYFDYFIIDEAHECKGVDSVQAAAMGSLSSAARKVVVLTGTLVGGYAWHVRTLLYRIGAGGSLARRGYAWDQEMLFNEAYGRIETRVVETEKAEGGDGYRQARGQKKRTKTRHVRPGIVPTLFGEHLVSTCTFLSLSELADNLPTFDEDVETLAADLDGELKYAYYEVEEALTSAVKQMVARGDKRLLGAMLNCLLCYPDYPFDWKEVGYWAFDEQSKQKIWNFVVKPPHMDPKLIYPKERALLDALKVSRRDGRQSWVYTTWTDKHDCAGRLEKLVRDAGLEVKVMRASVPPEDRERWIDTYGPGHEVLISHPQLVQTGLDFFSKYGSHNYCDLFFYNTGYNPFHLRQASRRAWRIGQRRACRVFYSHYRNTMQARALTLMGRKIAASLNLEGRFSSEGLRAMAGEDDTIEMELAKSLAARIKEPEPSRAWAKLKLKTGVRFRALEEAELAELELQMAMMAEMEQGALFE